MLPLNYSKHLLLLFVSMFTKLMRTGWRSLCQLSNRLYHRTSGIYIRLSINFAKRAGKWGAQSQLITNFNRLILFTFLPWFISQAMTNSEISACVNKREEGWSALLVEITSFMGAALKSLVGRGHIVLSIFWFVDNSHTPLKTYIFILYMISKT